MKIGILTYHEGLNYGAFLQAFATMRILQGLGHEVEIINYKNREHWLREDVRPWRVYRRPVRFIDHLKKRSAFKRDQCKMNLTKYTRNPEEVRLLHFDVVVVGSDVVWNYRIFGYDELYFAGLKADRKIAYAASFGWVNADDDHPDEVLEGLKRFDEISVRDDNSQRVVAKATGILPEKVLDPTFLLDFSGLEKETARIKKLGSYILVYAYSMGANEIDSVISYGKINGFKTVAVGYRQDWCDEVWMDVGPFEWLALYRSAEYVVTSTFHGTIFAIKYQRPFAVSMSDKIRNRVIPLLELIGAESRVFKNNTIPDGYIVINKEILQHKILHSREWLVSSLSGLSDLGCV